MRYTNTSDFIIGSGVDEVERILMVHPVKDEPALGLFTWKYFLVLLGNTFCFLRGNIFGFYVEIFLVFTWKYFLVLLANTSRDPTYNTIIGFSAVMSDRPLAP